MRGRAAGHGEVVALGPLNWDQLPAGSFAPAGEVSAVAPCHLGAKRSSLTSPPKIRTRPMRRRLQSSLPSRAVPGCCGRGDFACTRGNGVRGLWRPGTERPLCAPPVPNSPRDDGSPATSACSHAASAITPAPRVCHRVPAVTRTPVPSSHNPLALQFGVMLTPPEGFRTKPRRVAARRPHAGGRAHLTLGLRQLPVAGVLLDQALHLLQLRVLPHVVPLQVLHVLDHHLHCSAHPGLLREGWGSGSPPPGPQGPRSLPAPRCAPHGASAQVSQGQADPLHPGTCKHEVTASTGRRRNKAQQAQGQVPKPRSPLLRSQLQQGIPGDAQT